MLLPVAPEDAPFRILVLTAHDQTGRTLYAALEKNGFEVRRITEAIMGLAMWEGFNPHLIIIDGRPGTLEGLAVCRQARALEYLAPILLIGASDQAHELEGLKAGADDYLFEPVRIASVMGRVVAQLRRAYTYNVTAATTPEASDEDGLTPFWEEEDEAVDTPDEDAVDDFAPLEDFFGETPTAAVEDVLPAGWTECELCGYRAPRQDFEKEDLLGRIKLICPNCKESEHVVYSLN